MFSKSDFTVTIDPQKSAKDAASELEKYARAQEQEFAQLAKLESVLDLNRLKRPAPQPTPGRSVFLSLQRVRGTGTFWVLEFPYFLLIGWNLFVFPRPVVNLGATVAPRIGDQDIFLNSVFGPL